MYPNKVPNKYIFPQKTVLRIIGTPGLIFCLNTRSNMTSMILFLFLIWSETPFGGIFDHSSMEKFSESLIPLGLRLLTPFFTTDYRFLMGFNSGDGHCRTFLCGLIYVCPTG